MCKASITTTMITIATRIVPTRAPIIFDSPEALAMLTTGPEVVNVTEGAFEQIGSLKESMRISQAESISKSTCCIISDAIPLMIQLWRKLIMFASPILGVLLSLARKITSVVSCGSQESFADVM